MAKPERLFMRVFDRRAAGQLAEQAEGYDRALASSLLLSGIDPPPWLWSSGLDAHIADFRELKSGALFLPQQGLVGRGVSVSGMDTEFVDQSLLGIHRSRSRQKALELRNSGSRKSKRKREAEEGEPPQKRSGRMIQPGTSPQQITDLDEHCGMDSSLGRSRGDFVTQAQQLHCASDCSKSTGVRVLSDGSDLREVPDAQHAVALESGQACEVAHHTEGAEPAIQPAQIDGEANISSLSSERTVQPFENSDPTMFEKKPSLGAFSDNGTSVVSKQLSFDSMEECILNKASDIDLLLREDDTEHDPSLLVTGKLSSLAVKTRRNIIEKNFVEEKEVISESPKPWQLSNSLSPSKECPSEQLSFDCMEKFTFNSFDSDFLRRAGEDAQLASLQSGNLSREGEKGSDAGEEVVGKKLNATLSPVHFVNEKHFSFDVGKVRDDDDGENLVGERQTSPDAAAQPVFESFSSMEAEKMNDVNVVEEREAAWENPELLDPTTSFLPSKEYSLKLPCLDSMEEDILNENSHKDILLKVGDDADSVSIKSLNENSFSREVEEGCVVNERIMVEAGDSPLKNSNMELSNSCSTSKGGLEKEISNKLLNDYTTLQITCQGHDSVQKSVEPENAIEISCWKGAVLATYMQPLQGEDEFSKLDMNQASGRGSSLKKASDDGISEVNQSLTVEGSVQRYKASNHLELHSSTSGSDMDMLISEVAGLSTLITSCGPKIDPETPVLALDKSEMKRFPYTSSSLSDVQESCKKNSPTLKPVVSHLDIQNEESSADFQHAMKSFEDKRYSEEIVESRNAFVASARNHICQASVDFLKDIGVSYLSDMKDIKYPSASEDFTIQRKLQVEEESSNCDHLASTSTNGLEVLADMKWPAFEIFTNSEPPESSVSFLDPFSDLMHLSAPVLRTTKQILPAPFLSLPSGLLKQMTSSANSGTEAEQVLSLDEIDVSDNCHIFGSEVNASVQEQYYSYTPPIGKILSKSAGSDLQKHFSSNSELTCFPIEEDACISEGDEHLEEAMCSLDKANPCSEKNTSNIRSARVHNMTLETNKHSSTAAVGVRESIVYVKEDQYHMSQIGGKKHGKTQSCDMEFVDGKENACLFDENVPRRNTRSHTREVKRLKLSGKLSDVSNGQSYIKKGLKPNNIVSNIGSFIPLVMKKEKCSITTGKRDIRVKALEAAEAAKRLEEEKANARRMKKDAARIEKERMEQQKLQQLKLDQKRKEEEKMKKEADAAARKRQREEEDKKERERKRRCIEEARKLHKEREEKLQAEKKEKMRLKAMEMERKQKAVMEAAKKQQKVEKVMQGPSFKKLNDCDERTSTMLADDYEQLRCKDEENMKLNESDDWKKTVDLGSGCKSIEEVAETGACHEGESYVISPYRSSDGEEDEDEEEEENLSSKKFIPQWARESCMKQTLESLHYVDPDVIFLPQRCLSIDELPEYSK